MARRRATLHARARSRGRRRWTSCRCGARSRCRPATARAVRQVRMHDGSVVSSKRIDESYDPTDRDAAYAYLRDHQKSGQVVTGLLYVQEDSKDLHDVNKTAPGPLTTIPYESLTPGAAALAKLQTALPLVRSVAEGRLQRTRRVWWPVPASGNGAVAAARRAPPSAAMHSRCARARPLRRRDGPPYPSLRQGLFPVASEQ